MHLVNQDSNRYTSSKLPSPLGKSFLMLILLALGNLDCFRSLYWLPKQTVSNLFYLVSSFTTAI